MKRIFLYRLLVFLNIFICMFYTSCKKEKLTRINPNDITDVSFWKSEKDAIIGLNGVYDAFQVNNLAGQRYREFDLLTDNASMVNAQNGWGDIKVSTHNPTTLAVENFWRSFYTVVARANYVLDKVSAMPSTAISESARKKIMAEASFLRAYAYLDLTSLWGDVPFYTKAQTPFDEGKGKTSKAAIYTFIINELETEIIPNLPLNVAANENGRITKGAAQSLLGKYHLYNKDWSKAAANLQAVISSNVYKLFPSFTGLFTPQGEYSTESLFEIGFINGGIDNGENFSIQIDTNIAPRIPQSYWTPTQHLVNSFQAIDGKPIAGTDRSPLYNTATPYLNRDPRLRASILTNADNTPGGKKIWNYAANRPFAVGKFFMLTSEQFVSGPQNYYMIRYADVLLMYAEAQNESAGPDANVYSAVNQVRARVNMPSLPTGLSKDAMRSRIQDERRWEFAYEHQRYFDLKRWGLLKDAVISLNIPAAKFTDPRDWLWPYPQTELDNNPVLKSEGQNPGW